MPTPDDLVRRFALQPHPEGGFYRRTYASEVTVDAEALPDRFNGPRSTATAIYYLLTAPEGRSRLHRIQADEMWHFYLGDPLVVAEILADGSVRETVLGQDLARGEEVQFVVRGGTWFGAYLPPGSRWAFVGCTVSPGFDFADFEMGERAKLLKEFPTARALIERLTD